MPGHRREHLPLIGMLAFFSYVVDGSVETISLSIRTEFPDSVVEIDGDTVYNGHESEDTEIMKPIKMIPLLPGPNKIRIVVLGSAKTREYVLQVIRQFSSEMPFHPSTESSLRQLEVGPFSLMPDLPRWKSYPIPAQEEADSESIQTIKVVVDAQVRDFLVRAWPTHPAATITVEGTAVRSGDISPPIPAPWSPEEFGAVETTYWITVTAEDRKTSTMYEVQVKKQCAPGSFLDPLTDQCRDCRTPAFVNYPGFFGGCSQLECHDRCDITCVACESPSMIICPNKKQCINPFGHAETPCEDEIPECLKK
jgi:hypothetical protein